MGAVILVGMLVLWAGYGLGSWGYCLVKGWDVPLGSWFSPLSPYQWPKSGDPPIIPSTQVFPSAAALQQQADVNKLTGGVGQFVGGLMGDSGLIGRKPKRRKRA